MLVGLVMIDDNIRMPGLPDLFYASRVKHLLANGLLESQGDLAHMRYSEVRLPQPQS